ncbi:PP2C family protein-serine/threonine phosphatase [Streptomyces sp. AMCC400023]|uniref:PP2C family protein-serine/threonine phosphatase n=1 Tax=Streptomyces sp. AMCC400023 TaxID=2056258 RepID=UPI001F31E3E8|nr:mucin-2 [Streptomyces sp. AMCC400023]UJV42959.1 mucin-2 [Streptomyces sp. AMCC400023]
MRNYAAAQLIGTRTEQCDATAVRTVDGVRAYVLLDGIGSSEEVREWTRKAAVRLATRAARRGDAVAALTSLYEEYAQEPERQDPYMSRYMPKAAAVVAVQAPGRPLQIAWCGDSRAYLLDGGLALRLTEDHNMRRVFPPTATNQYGGNRNVITSYLGSGYTDKEVRDHYGHPAIESTTREVTRPCRLLLASDGAYEPLEDAGFDLFVELDDDPLTGIVQQFVRVAVFTSEKTTRSLDPNRVSADNATVLVAELTP